MVEFKVYTKQGKRGRWRFSIYREQTADDGTVDRKHWAVSSVRGYATKRQADDAAAEMLNGEWFWGD